jgi:YbgC/YbaW family acyl-CoA thioester hydrolase
MKKTIEFSETDMAGVVHFANFFVFFEIAEAAFMRSIGLSIFDAASNLRWPRVHASCDYKAPLSFGETATISLRIGDISERTVTFEFAVFKGAGGSTGVAATGKTIVVCAFHDSANNKIKSQAIAPETLALLRV